MLYSVIRLSSLTILCTFMNFAIANPQLQNVGAGNVSIQQTSTSTTVNQTSGRAIINWKTFNINSNERTHFNQPQGGVALNRINPMYGASQIYGKLTATGQIILINGSGIYFGPGSQVNVGGLIATTSNISDSNFQAGIYRFDQPTTSPTASIINKGKIIARENGLVALVGPEVGNSGLIQAHMGTVILATGNKFTIDFNGDQLINFSVTEATPRNGKITNKGKLIADGGRILVHAHTAKAVLDQTINMDGVAQANTVVARKGEIILFANNGKVHVSGKLIASGKSQGLSGGTIKVLAKKINVETAAILADGDLNGGNIVLAGAENNGEFTPANYISHNQCSITDASANTGVAGKITFLANKLDIGGHITAIGNHTAQGGIIHLSGTNTHVWGGSYLAAKGQNGGDITVGHADAQNVQLDWFSEVNASANANAGTIHVLGNNITTGSSLLAIGLGDQGIGGQIILKGQTTQVIAGSVVLAKGVSGGGLIQFAPVNNALPSSVTTSELAWFNASALGADATAGAINIQANELVLGGSMIANAPGTNSFGGNIRMDGLNIHIKNHFYADVSGNIGGGVIFLGKNPIIFSTPTTNNIVIEQGANFLSKATGEGRGGRISIYAKNNQIQGNFNASGLQNGFGGVVQVFGDEIKLLGNTKMLTTGSQGGGLINIGGTLNASGVEPNAQNVIVDGNVLLDASATDNGDGGRVVVWADKVNNFNGAAKARGGASGGDGGVIQIVGKEELIMNGTTDVSAPNGNDGTVLFTSP